MPGLNQAAKRKPIVCPICQKSFVSKPTKKNHMLIVHENAGRFKCSHCDKTFQSETHLKLHEYIHTGEKPFKCKKCPHPQCDMAFGREHGLKSHLVVHSGEKPFQCNDCSNRFTTKRLLKQHQRDLHQKKFKCDPCGRSFGRKANLKSHLKRRKHREDREEVDKQPDESNGFGKPTNCRAGQEDLKESDESESNAESVHEEAVQPELHAEPRTIKTENCLPDEQVSDDRIESSRSSGESDNENSDETDQEDERVEHDRYDRMEHDLDDPIEGCSKRIKIEDEEFELAPLVPTDFEAYDFKELAAANMRRMKMESEANSGQMNQEDELVQESSTRAS